MPASGPVVALARRAVRARLEGLKGGVLVLEEAGERRAFGDASAPEGTRATIRVVDPRFYSAMAFRGGVGAGEAFAKGWWETDDLVAVLRFCLENRPVLDAMESGWARLAAPFLRIHHALRANGRSGSRHNIAAHYDLGNDFFESFLDPTMTYSCGVFESEAATLEEASIAKIDRACRKLDLRPSDHLLEIGTGWGALALHAAREYGCRVTTTTISEEQHVLARERVREAGLDDRITVLRRDYRDLEGSFDKLVSIEMIEAVGHEHLATFFRVCSERLRADGLMLLQAITIQEQAWRRQTRSVDFIKRHVFPGSCLLSVASIAEAVCESTDMKPVHLEDIGPHYARTLREWAERFAAGRERVRELGYSDELIRGWHFYLAYCEAGFAERYLGDVQVLIAKPGSRHAIPGYSPGASVAP
jgi:cyclopropane-fatty-acyl-phospholipid synthase